MRERITHPLLELVELPLVALAIVLLAMAACRTSSSEPRGLVGAQSLCACPCAEDAATAPADVPSDAPEPDAAIDDATPAPPDAPAPRDLTAPWTRTIVTAGTGASGVLRGADGVARDAEGCWVTAWEEGSAVTRACPHAGGWVTEIVAAGLPGVEDARAADLDGDGVLDVASCSDAGQRCYVTFRGSPNTTVTLGGSLGRGHAVQVAIADVNGDGLPDVLFGTRVGATAAVGWLENPGALARTGSAWPFHQISPAGWTMSLVPLDVDHDGDIDVVVSDRVRLADGTYGMYGARWEEQTPTGWVNHVIAGGLPATPARPYQSGSCNPYASTTCNRTPGDEMFLTVVDYDGDGDLDIVDCTSANTQAASRISIHRNGGDWLTWTHETLPPVANVGHCQSVEVVTGGLVVSTWKDNAYPVAAAVAGQSGVYALWSDGAGGWTRGEVSGAEGGKFDNVVADGACVMTSEQLDPQGGFGVVRYCPPWEP